MDPLRIAIGSDHAGFALKEAVRQYLAGLGHIVEDAGAHSEASVDYPAIAMTVGTAVQTGKAQWGILVCGSGIGMSIVANKISGVRAALCYEPELAMMSRKHNDANVLVLAGRYTPPDKAREIVDAFLQTIFEGGRHQRRVDLIHTLTHR